MLLILSWLTAICAIEVSAQNFYRISSHYWNGDRTRDIPLPVDISLLDSNTQMLQCAMQLSKKWKLGGNECAVFQRKAGMPQCFIGTLKAHNCESLQTVGTNLTGEIQVWVASSRQSNCIMIQHRVSNSVNFYRNWTDYESGFGEGPSGNFWIGLMNIRAMTSVNPRRLYIEMRKWTDDVYWVSYSSFQIAGASDSYRLTSLGEFSSSSPQLGNCMIGHNNQIFTTFDRNLGSSCPSSYKGGWWYAGCHCTNPNGLYYYPPNALHTSTYADGTVWYHPFGYHYSLKEFKMMLW